MLGIAGLGAGAVACSGASPSAGSRWGSGSASKASEGLSAKVSSGPNQRVLVVVELSGGNDGFASLVPYADARFRKLRERVWVGPKDLDVIDDRYAVPTGLSPMKNLMAFVEGVGVARPDLSHFAMSDRWWHGDPDGKGVIQTGFLGRCCDALHGDEPVTGLSLGGGSSPAMVTNRAVTATLPQLDMVRDMAKDEEPERRLRASLARMAAPKTPTPNTSSASAGPEIERLTAVARDNLGSGLELLGTLNRVGETSKTYPEGNPLADALALARQLVSLDVGVRVFHIPWGSFDTHTGEVGSHGEQMRQFGDALAAFRADLEKNALADRVVVATTSEFGRRAESNGSGTDHGTASTMMLTGAVRPGRHGTAPDFSRLDPDGNVRATVSMLDYYATLAHWLGLDVTQVAGKGAVPVTGLLA
jgi:uncharacterized protein (DUF1501 family)